MYFADVLKHDFNDGYYKILLIGRLVAQEGKVALGALVSIVAAQSALLLGKEKNIYG